MLIAQRRITHQLDKSPDTLTTGDLKRYFTPLFKTHSWSTVKIDRNGLQFFKHVLQHYWRWILPHVLPKGFRRVRDYGLFRGHEKKLLQAIQFMFMLTG